MTGVLSGRRTISALTSQSFLATAISLACAGNYFKASPVCAASTTCRMDSALTLASVES
jgi:hypothetical protein